MQLHNPQPRSPATQKRVLVVDDERDVRELLAMSLESGYHVDSAANGAEALAMLETEQFDALVLDLMMPVMDGVALLGELERRRIALPIALTSAHHKTGALAEQHGVFAIPKPYTMAQVRSWLEVVTQRS